jgi:hypothetical protein
VSTHRNSVRITKGLEKGGAVKATLISGLELVALVGLRKPGA